MKKQFPQIDRLIYSYPSLVLNKVIIHRQPMTEMKYLKVADRNNLFKRDMYCKNSNISIFNLSSIPICLPPFSTLPSSIPHQKHSPHHSTKIIFPNNVPPL